MKFLVLFLSLASAPQLSSASTFKSEQYGFSVNTSGFAMVCQDLPPAPSHGLIYSMEADQCSNVNARDAPSNVRIWAEYNVADEAASAEALAKSYCPPKAVIGSIKISGKSSSYCSYSELYRDKIGYFIQDKQGSEVDQAINFFILISSPKGGDTLLLKKTLDRLSFKKSDD